MVIVFFNSRISGFFMIFLVELPILFMHCFHNYNFCLLIFILAYLSGQSSAFTTRIFFIPVDTSCM